MKQILNTSTNSDFISKCTNYIYNAYIYYISIIPYRLTYLQLISLLGDLKCLHSDLYVAELFTGFSLQGDLFLAELTAGLSVCS